MIIYENDVLEIPENIKKMTLTEIKEEEKKLLSELLKEKKTVRRKPINQREIKFNI